MVVPKEILVGQIEDVIEKKGGAYLESYALFDLKEVRSKPDSNPLHILSYSVQRIRLWKRGGCNFCDEPDLKSTGRDGNRAEKIGPSLFRKRDIIENK